MSSSEDEVDVDILGELPSPPPISSELLKCDYTVDSQWLLDSSATSCWYDTSHHDDNVIHNSSDDDGRPSTSNEKVVWTATEKKLLHRGLEIYGKNPEKLSTFIGTKTLMEIRTFIEAEYGLDIDINNSSIESKITRIDSKTMNHEYGDVLSENEIPASIEEVICMINTAEPTVPNIKRGMSNVKYIDKKIRRSNPIILTVQSKIEEELQKNKNNITDVNCVQKDTISIINEVCNNNKDSLLYGIPKKSKGLKKYCSLSSEKHQPSPEVNDRDKKLSNKEKHAKYISSSPMISFSTNNKFSSKKRYSSLSKQKHNIPKVSTFMQIVTGSGQAVPLCEGEQVVKIEKCMQPETESDIEIDIDSDFDEKPLEIDLCSENTKEKKMKSRLDTESIKTTECLETEICEKMSDDDNKLNDNEKHGIQFLNLSSSVKAVMESLNVPQDEFIFAENEINEIEKILCSEFFEGKPSKTVERYIFIRSHILNSWLQCRPSYLTKTAIRQGLKNCGDVNCIGKIHTILEQIGAINFGCEQISYIRPLTKLLKNSALRMDVKNFPQANSFFSPDEADSVKKYDLPRKRKKKITVDGVGGYTITHTEYGEFFEASSEPKQQRSIRKKPVNLIYCKIFSEDYPAPFHIQLLLSTLIHMDVHSYTSHAEVMGLLGGHYLSSANLVLVEKYVPCNSLENSGTHCDMCPVSQSAASELLTAFGYETVGWYHSHPKFPPQPSAQDICSQTDLQNAFHPKPFIAIIVSPYWPTGRTSSQYRCFITKREIDDTGEYNIAYKFKIHIHCDMKNQKDVDELISSIRKLREDNITSSKKYVINMDDCCQSTNMTYLEKCLTSVRYHLSMCNMKPDNSIYNSILSGISKTLS